MKLEIQKLLHSLFSYRSTFYWFNVKFYCSIDNPRRGRETSRRGIAPPAPPLATGLFSGQFSKEDRIIKSRTVHCVLFKEFRQTIYVFHSHVTRGKTSCELQVYKHLNWCVSHVLILCMMHKWCFSVVYLLFSFCCSTSILLN